MCLLVYADRRSFQLCVISCPVDSLWLCLTQTLFPGRKNKKQIQITLKFGAFHYLLFDFKCLLPWYSSPSSCGLAYCTCWNVSCSVKQIFGGRPTGVYKRWVKIYSHFLKVYGQTWEGFWTCGHRCFFFSTLLPLYHLNSWLSKRAFGNSSSQGRFKWCAVPKHVFHCAVTSPDLSQAQRPRNTYPIHFTITINEGR